MIPLEKMLAFDKHCIMLLQLTAREQENDVVPLQNLSHRSR